MKKYIDYVRIAFREHVVYKNAVIAKLLSKVIYLYLQYHIWDALFSSNSMKNHLVSKNNTLRYVVVATLISCLMECNIIDKINASIQSGNVAMDLLRPMNYKKMYFAKSLGDTMAKLLFYFLPLVIFISYIFPFAILCKKQFVAGIISVLLAYGIQFYYSLMIGLLAFWLIVTWPINMFLDAIYKLLSGIWIPVTMFPDALRRLGNFFPFQAIYSIPITILTQQQDQFVIMQFFAIQIFWLVLLWLGTGLIWHMGRRKLCVQGG